MKKSQLPSVGQWRLAQLEALQETNNGYYSPSRRRTLSLTFPTILWDKNSNVRRWITEARGEQGL